VGERRAVPGLVLAAAFSLICAAVAGVAAAAAVHELVRGPSPAEIERASAAEVARRWEVWPSGRIFPARLPYTNELGGTEQARRVGVSSRYSCDAAVDRRLRKPLRDAGCRAVLRATYLDALQGIVVTVGVAVFPDDRSAAAAKAAFPADGAPAPGLLPVAFPGTVADRFTAASRQAATVRQAGPYLVLTTAGQVDGRPAAAVGKPRTAMFAFTADLGARVAEALTAPPTPDCARPREWRC